MFALSLATPPASEPVSLAEAKAHMRIDTTAEDTLISTLITGARLWAERYTNRAFITQTFDLALDPYTLDNRFIRLPRAPLQSLVSLTLFDDDDTETSWSLDNVFADTRSEPGRMVLRTGATWPTPTRTAHGLVVRYTAGYGNGSGNVPEPIRAGILELVAQWYAHRGDDMQQTSFAAQALLAPYRLRFAGL